MIEILLVYPFFKQRFDNTPFRFPPLGIGYIASILKEKFPSVEIEILDGTFRNYDDIIDRIRLTRPRIVGMYAMYSMDKECINLARHIRQKADLFVVGGPLPTVDPINFIEDFDVVVIGEAESTMVEIAERYLNGKQVNDVDGIVYKDGNRILQTAKRKQLEDLDSIPFPARELFDNESYMNFYKENFGYKMTSMISSRGCPFRCDFCSRPVFGDVFRTRSPRNIVDEMESIVRLGYDTIWFADDCFTLSKKRIMRICNEINHRGLNVKWQCLSRVDRFDSEMALEMKEAGCQRIYFGIEAGDNKILRKMNKDTDLTMASNAVKSARYENIETGAFFIIGYPGDNNESILNTLRFATSLPFDYVSFTFPYPIPGTGLYERLKHDLKEPSKRKFRLIDQHLTFRSEFSEIKLKFAIIKAAVQFRIRKYLGKHGYAIFGYPFEKITDFVFKMMK